MYDVVFKSDLIGLLMWILLFTTSTMELALVIRSTYLEKTTSSAISRFIENLEKKSLLREDFDIAYVIYA